MNKFRIHLVLALTLLIALGAVFGVSAVSSAHAAKASKNASIAIASSAHMESTLMRLNAINVDCNGRSDFFTLYSQVPLPRGQSATFTTCYANGGDIRTSVPYVVKVCTGNNVGQVLSQDQWQWSGILNRWSCYPFHFIVVAQVHIQ